MTNSVAELTTEAERLRADAAVGRALMGGTASMRAAGEAYLPKFDGETRAAYNARVGSSFLFNGYRKTVRDMAGRVFAKPLEISEGEIDESIEANIDGQGRDLSVFCRDVFEDAVGGSGISYILVEAPRRKDEVTRAQAQDMGLRPYFVHVTVDDVLGWRSAQVGGRVILTQFRIMETVKEQDPSDEFKEDEIAQVRVWTLDEMGVGVRIYRQEDKKQAWALYDEYRTEAGEITIVPFYANRTSYFMAEPLLQDLADLNVAHWQSGSDQRNILHFARVPILSASGYDDENGNRPLTVSAGTATTSRDTDFKLSWVEHSGAAIGAGRDDLKDLEFQMQAFGLQLLVAQQETATGAALDAAKETAPLSMMADSLKDTVEQALMWLAMYQGRDDIFTVTVNKEFGVTMLTAQEVTAMLTAVNTGQLSRETFIKEMARRGFIAPDIIVEDELDRIEEDDNGLMVAPDGISE